MRFLKLFTVVLIVIGLILLLSELFCGFILEKIYNRNFDTALVEKNVYETSHALKSFIQTQVWGQKFTTDRFRSRPQKAISKKGKHVFIGDSVLEGIGLPDSLIFTELLNGETVDILNLSMPGNRSKDYLSILRCITDSSHPSYIEGVVSIHIVHCLNDIYGKTSSSDLPISQRAFYSKISNQLLNIKTYQLIKLLIYQNSDYYYQYDAAFYKDEPKVEETMTFYKGIDSLCSAKGMPLSFYMLPYKSQFVSKDFYPQQQLLNKFEAANIKVIDLTKPLTPFAANENLYLFADEIHFSASGHKAIAEIIAKSHNF
jgi:hypothetical protein